MKMEFGGMASKKRLMEMEKRLIALQDEFDKEIRHLSSLKHQIDMAHKRINKVEASQNKAQLRFDAVVRFFEHRVDQIYSRILPVLTGKGVVPKAKSNPQPEMANVVANDMTARMKQELENSGEFLYPGLFKTPLSPFGFRPVVGTAIEEEDGVYILGDHAGLAIFGPYKRISIGKYTLKWGIASANALDPKRIKAKFEVYAHQKPILGETVYEGTPKDGEIVELDFDVDVVHRNLKLEIRVEQQADEAFIVKHLELVGRKTE